MTAATPAAAVPLNVLSFNIRYDNPADGPNAWPHRRALVAGLFTDRQVDVAGLQEVLHRQLDDLQKDLPGYGWIGVGREDGKEQGEYAPIFYRRERFTPEKQGTFWLSPTPEEVGSRGWDAALARIATWAILRDQSTGKRFFFVNTHFDHRGEEARRQSAALLVQRAAALCEGLPVMLTGDFNTTAGSPPVQTLTSGARLKLVDSASISQTPHTGGNGTVNGFRADVREQVIDFVFVGPGVRVGSHGYFPVRREGVFISDHWPVVSQLSLP